MFWGTLLQVMSQPLNLLIKAFGYPLYFSLSQTMKKVFLFQNLRPMVFLWYIVILLARLDWALSNLIEL